MNLVKETFQHTSLRIFADVLVTHKVFFQFSRNKIIFCECIAQCAITSFDEIIFLINDRIQ